MNRKHLLATIFMGLAVGSGFLFAFAVLRGVETLTLWIMGLVFSITVLVSYELFDEAEPR